jgi:hypothetical protein
VKLWAKSLGAVNRKLVKAGLSIIIIQHDQNSNGC